MAENPFQSMLNPNAAKAGLWDMRMMAAANRSESPFERGMRSSYGNRGVSGDPMLAGLAGMANEPDYSQFTYDPVMRQRAMDAGVQPLEASQVKQNVLLPNTGFFGNHPRLSAALEGGIFGAAASHGGNTPGESIQGALEGMIGGSRIRQGMQRQQFARPFEAAGMLEGIADMKQKRELQDAEIQHLRAENQKLGRPDHDFRAFGVSRNDPEIATIDNTTGKVTYSTNPHYDPNAAGGNSPEEQFFASKRAEAKARGISVTSDMIGNWQKEWTDKHVPPEHAPHALVAVPDGKGGVTYQEARPGSHFDRAPQTVGQAGGQAEKDKAARDKWIKDNSEVGVKSASIWMAAGISPGDKDAAKKLGQFYDSNIAPYLTQPPESSAPSGFTKNPDGSYTQN